MTIKIDRKDKASKKIAGILDYLSNGLSTDETRQALMHVCIRSFNSTLYAATTDGSMCLWHDISGLTDIGEGIYAIECTKKSYFLTLETDILYPQWEQIALGKNEIHSDLPESWLSNIYLGKESCGTLNALIGSIASKEGYLYFFNQTFFERINKNAKKEVWEVMHLPDCTSPIRLKSETGKCAMIMPIRKIKTQKEPGS